MPTQRSSTTISLPSDYRARLDTLADIREETRSQWVRRMIDQEEEREADRMEGVEDLGGWSLHVHEDGRSFWRCGEWEVWRSQLDTRTWAIYLGQGPRPVELGFHSSSHARRRANELAARDKG